MSSYSNNLILFDDLIVNDCNKNKVVSINRNICKQYKLKRNRPRLFTSSRIKDIKCKNDGRKTPKLCIESINSLNLKKTVNDDNMMTMKRKRDKQHQKQSTAYPPHHYHHPINVSLSYSSSTSLINNNVKCNKNNNNNYLKNGDNLNNMLPSITSFKLSSSLTTTTPSTITTTSRSTSSLAKINQKPLRKQRLLSPPKRMKRSKTTINGINNNKNNNNKQKNIDLTIYSSLHSTKQTGADNNKQNNNKNDDNVDINNDKNKNDNKENKNNLKMNKSKSIKKLQKISSLDLFKKKQERLAFEKEIKIESKSLKSLEPLKQIKKIKPMQMKKIQIKKEMIKQQSCDLGIPLKIAQFEGNWNEPSPQTTQTTQTQQTTITIQNKPKQMDKNKKHLIKSKSASNIMFCPLVKRRNNNNNNNKNDKNINKSKQPNSSSMDIIDIDYFEMRKIIKKLASSNEHQMDILHKSINRARTVPSLTKYPKKSIKLNKLNNEFLQHINII